MGIDERDSYNRHQNVFSFWRSSSFSWTVGLISFLSCSTTVIDGLLIKATSRLNMSPLSTISHNQRKNNFIYQPMNIANGNSHSVVFLCLIGFYRDLSESAENSRFSSCAASTEWNCGSYSANFVTAFLIFTCWQTPSEANHLWLAVFSLSQWRLEKFWQTFCICEILDDFTPLDLSVQLAPFHSTMSIARISVPLRLKLLLYRKNRSRIKKIPFIKREGELSIFLFIYFFEESCTRFWLQLISFF